MNNETVKNTEGLPPIAPATKKRTSPPPIELVYRQVFDVLDSKVYGFESQIRINDKKLGTLTPDLFVPIAERSNQIVELGKWSFVEMSDMIRRQREKEHTIARMFMSVSAKYFCKRYFTDNVLRQAQKAGMAPDDICVMLPAQAMLENANGLHEAVIKVRDTGLKVAICGLGDGGLSLTQLSELPVDFLRFDARFTATIAESERLKDVANTFSELAVKLGAQLVADGVDTKEQAAALQSIGCSLMQGPYFGEFERESRMF